MCGTLLQDRERHGCRARAHTDVLVASPEGRYRATSAPLPINSQLVYWLFRIKHDRYDQDLGLGVSRTVVDVRRRLNPGRPVVDIV